MTIKKPWPSLEAKLNQLRIHAEFPVAVDDKELLWHREHLALPNQHPDHSHQQNLDHAIARVLAHQSNRTRPRVIEQHIHHHQGIHWGWLLGAALIIVWLLLFGAPRAHAQYSQINVIKIKNGGTTVKSFAGPFTLNCSTNMTCGISGNTLNLSSTGGGAATGYQTLQNATVAIAQQITLNWTAGIVCADNAGASRSDCALANVAAVSHKFFNSVVSGALVLAQPDYGDLTGVPGTFAPAAHNLLSAAHGDTTAASAVRGDGIFAIGVTPTWQRLAHPSVSGGYFKWNGTDIVASTLAASGTGSPTACTNQAITAFTLVADSAPTSTCTTITSAFTSGTFAPTAHNLLSASHGDTVAASPVLGDILYGNSTPAWTKLAGNITTTKQYLSQTGNASISAAPAWAQVAYADLSGTPQLPITKAAVGSNWLNSYTSSTGLFTASQPAFTDISGSVAASQMPALTGAITTSAGAVATSPGKIDVLDSSRFCQAAGASSTTYTCNLSPAITAYVTGTHYRFKADVANTAASTINFNGQGATTIKKASGGITTDLAANDMQAGQWVDLVYDGTNMQMQSTLGNAAVGGTGASTADSFITVSHDADLTGERTLKGTANHVTINDGGANGDITLDTGANVTLSGALSNNVVPKGSGTNTLVNSSVTDDGTTWTGTDLWALNPTWNTGATLFTGMTENVTDTASQRNSLLADLQLAGSTRFKVEKSGTTTITGNSQPAQPGFIDIRGTAAYLGNPPSGVCRYFYDSTASTARFVDSNGNKCGPTTTSAGASAVTPFDYGAKGDGVTLTNCAITSGGAAVTCVGSAFTSADAGKAFIFNRAGVASSPQANALVTTILSVTDATHVTLAANAGSTVASSGLVYYGSDDTGALRQCISNGTLKGGKCTISNGVTFIISSNGASTINFISANSTPIPGGAIDGTGTIIFAPQGTLTGGTNDRLFYAASSALNPMPVAGGPSNTFTITTTSETSTTATYNTSGVCNFTTGQIVQAQGVNVAGYNGVLTVLTPGCNGGSLFTATLTAGLGAGTGGTVGGALAKGDTSFKLLNSSDASQLSVSQWLILRQRDDLATDVTYVDWVQIASISGTTITVTNPLRMAFPNAVKWSGASSYWGLGIEPVTNLLQNITMRDFILIIPQVVSTNKAVGIAMRDTQGFTLLNLNCDDASQNCLATYLDQGMIMSQSHLNSQAAIEISSPVDWNISNNNINQMAGGVFGPAQAAQAQCILVDYGAGFGSFTGNTCGPYVNAGIDTLVGFHDSNVTGNTFGWNVSNSGSCVRLHGAYNNAIENNNCPGGNSGTVGIGVDDASASIRSPINSDTNRIWLNSVDPNFPGGSYSCTGTTLGTDNCFDPSQLSLVVGSPLSVTPLGKLTIVSNPNTIAGLYMKDTSSGNAVTIGPGVLGASAFSIRNGSTSIFDYYYSTKLFQTQGEIEPGASTTSLASINIPTGAAPTSPVAGDEWFASSEFDFFGAAASGALKLYDSGGVNAITHSSSGTITSYTDNEPLAAASGVQFGVNSSNTITQNFSGDSAHSISQLAKTAAVTTFTLCAATANTACGQAGQYRISYNFYGSGTACATVTAGSVGLNLTWTDTNAVTHTTISLPLWDQKSAAMTNGVFNFNTALGTESASGSYIISTNGTIIQAATTYVACTSGTGTYNLKMTVEQLQ